LADFLGLDMENGLEIGKVGHHDIPVKLSMTRLLQKHLSILALSGAGKSYLTSVLIEELLDRDEDAGKVATVVIDTHGEYIGFGDDENYRKDVNIVRGDDFKIGVPNVSPSLFFHLKPGLSGAQRRELDRILRELQKEKSEGTYGMSELGERIAEDDTIKSSTREVLLSELSQLKRTDLFGVTDNPPVDQIAESGKATILDISDITSLETRQMLVTYLARKLFFARQNGDIPPFVLVVEEAHNFAPEGKKRKNALSRPIIQRIAREGRKFHASLCLISQRPIKLDTTALSQCNTNIIMRITNPYDQDHIGKSSEGLSRDVLDTISSLRVGESFIVGEAVNYPLFAKIRERKSEESERGMPLEEAARQYQEQQQQKEEDAESFM
ncbi:MAG: ATP-binding protein, partial [Candidatus Aenigmatarchaeota archaeon]